jgi:choline monooxygenase
MGLLPTQNDSCFKDSQPSRTAPNFAASRYCREETYSATRAPVESAFTLNPDAYRSAEFYGLESDLVFGKSWVCVGYTSQLREPGDKIVATVDGQSILLTCDKECTIRAFYNVCRHRGSLLVEESNDSKVIRCPYHSWGYGLDGRLLGAPYFVADEPLAETAAGAVREMKSFCKDDFGLLSVRVETWGCFVFVNLDGNARPLSVWLGDLPARLKNYPLADFQLHRRQLFDVNANWKLVAENFIEYYHLPWVHPELNTVSTLDNHQRWQGPGMYTGMCTHPLTQQNLPIDPGVLPLTPGISAHDANTAYWVLIAPNVALFLLPHHLFTLVINPHSFNHTTEYADLLVHPASLETPGAENALDAIFEFWAMVNQQDVAAVERVQRGVQAKPYQGGRMCFKFEDSIHRFQNMIIDLMTGKVSTPPGDDGP